MYKHSVTTPVVIIIFNRPDTTARVFAEVARARPGKLLMVADGPRPDRPGEAEQCAATRKIIERVDWLCEVLTNYADSNMGCRRRVSSGLNWVFETVEEAIILEDDCVPDPSFFRFCDELLARYRTDERIMMISGNNFQDGRIRGQASYYFSRYAHIWGWASWRRAWQHYDVAMTDWPQVCKAGLLNEILDDPGQVREWAKDFDTIHSGIVDTWAVPWLYTCWSRRGLSIMPNVNLVSNIGFREDAAHTKDEMGRFADMPVLPMDFPLQHPPTISRSEEADRYTERNMFHVPFVVRARRALQKAVAKVQRW